MEIKFLKKENISIIRELAALLAEAFPHCYGDCTMEDMAEYLEEERIALMAVEDGHLLGFVGAMPQYDYAWELHPLAVKKEYKHRGVLRRGTAALIALKIPVVLPFTRKNVSLAP